MGLTALAFVLLLLKLSGCVAILGVARAIFREWGERLPGVLLGLGYRDENGKVVSPGRILTVIASLGVKVVSGLG